MISCISCLVHKLRSRLERKSGRWDKKYKDYKKALNIGVPLQLNPLLITARCAFLNASSITVF